MVRMKPMEGMLSRRGPPHPAAQAVGKPAGGAGDGGSVMLSAIGTDICRFDAVARTPLRQG